MLHEPAATPVEKDHAIGSKATLGLWLFAVYSMVYVGFVAINILRPQWMGLKVLAGLNLAVVFGFGLIVSAIVLGLIYNHRCSRLEDRMNRTSKQETGL